MINTYSPKVFSKLNSFDAAKRLLNLNREKIIELGNVIVRHDLHEYLGISLLHKHFEVYEEEMLVEEFHQNTIITEPRIVEEKQQVTPYLWKFDSGSQSESFGYFPLEFVENTDDTSLSVNLHNLLISNSGFLSEMAEKIVSLDVADIFGLSTIHRDNLVTQNGEIIIERSNRSERKLFINTELNEKSDQLTETLWKFSPSNNSELPNSNCNSCCTICCVVHCGYHPSED